LYPFLIGLFLPVILKATLANLILHSFTISLLFFTPRVVILM
jgi:hypothetical protein